MIHTHTHTHTHIDDTHTHTHTFCASRTPETHEKHGRKRRLARITAFTNYECIQRRRGTCRTSKNAALGECGNAKLPAPSGPRDPQRPALHERAPEKGQPENREVVQSAQRRRERLPTIPKNRKVLAEKKAREKNGRAAAMIRKSRSCCAEERMQKRKHPMRLENIQTRHVALLGRGTARKKPFQGNTP